MIEIEDFVKNMPNRRPGARPALAMTPDQRSLMQPARLVAKAQNRMQRRVELTQQVVAEVTRIDAANHRLVSAELVSTLKALAQHDEHFAGLPEGQQLAWAMIKNNLVIQMANRLQIASDQLTAVLQAVDQLPEDDQFWGDWSRWDELTDWLTDGNHGRRARGVPMTFKDDVLDLLTGGRHGEQIERDWRASRRAADRDEFIIDGEAR